MPLHVAAKYKQEEVAKLLISYGADVNARDGNGKTPIFYVAHNNNYKIVELLLENGVDVNTSDEHTCTPLHIAAEGHKDVVKVLLKFYADIDSQDEWGNTALHIASSARCRETVGAFLEHGADINIISKNNETPLNVAIAVVCMCRIREAQHFFACARDARARIIVDILKRHVVQMKTANLYVSEKNLRSVSSCELRDFRTELEKEIVSLKIEKFNNANASFYDILTKDMSISKVCRK
jgi:ankyrin repeat protein